LDILSDYHLLLYLVNLNLFDFKKDFEKLCEAIKEHNHNKFLQVLETKSWATLCTVLQEVDEMETDVSTTVDFWSCLACSYRNSAMASHCSMCGTSKDVHASSFRYSSTEWSCSQCTYLNSSSVSLCEICGASRS
jgi:rubrerythrin